MKKHIRRTHYLSKLFAYKDQDLIKVVSGLRRSGKSTLLLMYQEELLEQGVQAEQIFSMNFEEFENQKFFNDLEALYQHILASLDLSKRNYVFLDEIQNVKGFERLIDGLYIKPNFDVYITGSNAFLLSGELATLLSGRYIEISILPFSFKEYLIARQVDIANRYLNYELFFYDYINETSLPKGMELRAQGFGAIYEYLDAIYKTIIEKDISYRNEIYDKQAFEKVVKFVASNLGSQLSPGNIAKTLKQEGYKIHNTTVERYLENLVAGFVFYKANRFDLKGKKQLMTQEKYYLVDAGLLNYLIGRKRTTDRGHILENVVYLELLRRGYKVWIGTARNYEVDFVCRTPEGDIEYYQVAWLLANDETTEREFGALEAIKDNFPKHVLTTDSFVQDRNGIKHRNVFQWLCTDFPK